jgi:hypothetical protein
MRDRPCLRFGRRKCVEAMMLPDRIEKPAASPIILKNLSFSARDGRVVSPSSHRKSRLQHMGSASIIRALRLRRFVVRLCQLPGRAKAPNVFRWLMVSRVPFSFTNSRLVAPVICPECGANAHCVRRVPKEKAELQTFLCKCGNEITELREEEVSDYEIQRDAEQLTGVRKGAKKSLDRSQRRGSYRGWLEDMFTKANRKIEANERGDQDTKVDRSKNSGRAK